MMHRFFIAAAFAALLPTMVQAATAQTPRGKAWWADIEAIASDATEGRLPGSPGFDRAAAYVTKRFTAMRLRPAGRADAGAGGFAQPVALQSQTIDHGASSGALIATDGSRAPAAARHRRWSTRRWSSSVMA